MIYFETWAGLCNRLRGMAAAYAFAKELEEPLTVIWESDVNCNCRFESLFDITAEIPMKVINFDCMGSNPFKKAEHQINKLRKKYMKSRCEGIYTDEKKAMDLEHIKASAKEDSVYIKSYYMWYPTSEPYDFLEIKPEIKKKIDKLVGQCDNRGVGVHIRRTDHQTCIHNSPTEAFIREMKKEPDDTIFYVATDDSSEREKLKNVFGSERIVYQAGAELSRGTKKGMEAAVIDLYTLSRMNKILGSDTSSFTEVAGQIGWIPVIICS